MKSQRAPLCGLPVVLLGLGLVAVAGTQPGADGNHMHGSIPAGYDVVVLKPSGASLSLMGLVECPELEGAQHVSEGLHRRLVSAEGHAINKFPQRFSFRVTASLRKLVLDTPGAAAHVMVDPHELLLKLKFRIRAYHGLEVHQIVPESVEMIGVPADVPYDERVYRITLNNLRLAITDRLVVEILSPQGEVLTHFPFSPL
jgi:hypothetical protein